MSGIPIPKPSYLDNCDYLGMKHGSRRWRSKDGKRLYTWDSLHGEIEVFDKRGIHLAVYDPNGAYKSSKIKGRKIDV